MHIVGGTLRDTQLRTLGFTLIGLIALASIGTDLMNLMGTSGWYVMWVKELQKYRAQEVLVRFIM